MSQYYHIQAVKQGKTWRSKFATGEGDDMQDYYVKFTEMADTVKMTQKTTTPPPLDGPIYGHLETSIVGDKTYYKFKKDQVPEGTVPGASPAYSQAPLPVAAPEAPWQEILKELQEQTRLLRNLAREHEEDLPDVFPD